MPTITINNRTYVIQQHNNMHYIYDASRTRLLGQASKLEDAVNKCEEMAHESTDEPPATLKSCRGCKYCDIRYSELSSERHYCRVTSTLLDRLTACGMWEGRG